MKNRTLLSLITLIAITAPWGIQAQAATETIKTLEVECSSQTYFTENECGICQDGGEVTTDAKGAIVNAQEFSWENSLTGKNQNFYKSGQPVAEIKTNIGTASTAWDQMGLDWGTDIIFTKVDIQNIFSLEAGKTVKIKTIADKTNIPITSIKNTANAYLMLKIPISYYELAMGASSQGDKKTTNYCVSYTPKINSAASSSTTTTATSPATTTTTTNTPDTPTVSNPTTSTDPETTIDIPEKLVEADPANNSEEIPSYDAKVSLNSAADPTVVAATRVETGPREILIITIALLLGVALFPRVNKIFL